MIIIITNPPLSSTKKRKVQLVIFWNIQASNNFELCKLTIFAILEICKLANSFFSFKKYKLASFTFLRKLEILSFLRCASLATFAILYICKLTNSFFSFDKWKLASFSFLCKLAILPFLRCASLAIFASSWNVQASNYVSLKYAS